MKKEFIDKTYKYKRSENRLSTIRNADRIAVIGNGNVLESGSYEELMEQKDVFYQMEHL